MECGLVHSVSGMALATGENRLTSARPISATNAKPLRRIALYALALAILCVSANAVEVAPQPRTIHSIAGTGITTNNGDGLASMANIGQTFGVEFGPDGCLYICEVENHRVRRLDLKTNAVTTAAGNGIEGYAGDGGLAANAAMNEPYEIRFDDQGNMYVVEMMNHIVRRVDSKTKRIETIAGTGASGFSGDGGPATKAQLNRPHSIALSGHSLFIADIGNHRIRRVNLTTGTIDTVAGDGTKTLPVDGTIATGKPMVGPRALFANDSMLWIALREGHSVWKMSLQDFRLTHVAGTGKKGYDGDGGSGHSATFNGPKGITVDATDRVYVVDTENQVIRMIDTKSDRVSTVAGNGQRGFGGDEGSATNAAMDRPHGICLGPNGAIYIGDTNNHRVRVVRP